MFNFSLERIIYILPGIIIGLTVHEFSHAFAAYKLGDPTAKDMGRLTFNPLVHIDPIGFLFIVIASFGWAKPVQFNPYYLKNYRRDKAIIAAAGPLSNLILSILLAGLFRLCMFPVNNSLSSGNVEMALTVLGNPVFRGFLNFLQYAIMINLGLMVFNLIPIPPLDGSHIAFSSLNLRPETEYRIMRIGSPLLFMIIIVQNMTRITILPIGLLVNAIMRFLLPF